MGTEVFWGLFTPFLGTSLGACCVFFLKKELKDQVQRGLTGFASGVMVAASIWSLLIPAMEQSEGAGTWAFLPAVLGFWAGILFLLGLDHLIPHLYLAAAGIEIIVLTSAPKADADDFCQRIPSNSTARAPSTWPVPTL